MNTEFKIEAKALVNRLLNDTPDDELLRLIEEAEEGVYHLCKVPIFCEFTSASTLSAHFPVVGVGAFDFQVVVFSKWANAGDAANYEDLALAA
jgi:hypothetical protein